MHQVWSLTAVQVDAVVVTVKLVYPAGDVTFWFEGETKSVGAVACWVTVEVWEGSPEALTVIVATRIVVPVFSL